MTTIAMQHAQYILTMNEKPYLEEDGSCLTDQIDDAIEKLVASMDPVKLFQMIWEYEMIDGEIVHDVGDNDPKVMLRSIGVMCVTDAILSQIGWIDRRNRLMHG